MSKPDAPPPDDALPATKLADLAAKARAKIGKEPDKAGISATRTFAAIVRDLKGMPEISVSRESNMKIRVGRRGKVGGITLEYIANIVAIELNYLSFSTEPTDVKVRRYTLGAEEGSDEWLRLDRGGELLADVREAMLKLYPEIGEDE